MVEFQVKSSMGQASAQLKREGKIERFNIGKNLYEKEISVRWTKSLKSARRYRIHRLGHMNKQSRIYKGSQLLGIVETELGLSSYVRIRDKKKQIFEIKESRNPLNRRFEILRVRDGDKVGELSLEGVHLPLFSRLGKGVYGYYNHLKPKEEELLLTSIIALGV